MAPANMAPAEVIIVGGGTMGLAIAVELQQRGTQVSVLSRDLSTRRRWNASA